MRIIVSFFLSLILASCEDGSSQESVSYVTSSKLYPIYVGDCFFIDSVPGFGMVLNEVIVVNNDKEEYGFIPLKLDTVSRTIDQFKNGKINISLHDNFGQKFEGLFIFSVLNAKEFSAMYKHFSKVGNLNLKESRHVSGGTTFSTLEELKTRMEFFDDNYNMPAPNSKEFMHFLGVSHRVASVQEIINN